MEKEDFLMRLTSSEDEEAAVSTRLQYYNKVPDVTTHTHACDPFRVEVRLIDKGEQQAGRAKCCVCVFV